MSHSASSEPEQSGTSSCASEPVFDPASALDSPRPGDEFFSRLIAALPFIARVTGGYATVTDKAGIRLHTVDSEGKEHPELVGKTFQPGTEAAHIDEGGIVGSDFASEAQSWVLPLGDYVLACSNIERVERDRQLLDALRQALPIIARMVGGEAVLFDVEGRRIASYDHAGTENGRRLGLVSPAAAEAMRTNRPTVGPSNTEEGAVAVRFPVTPSFGFGFNNEQYVKREKILLDEARKGRNTRYSFSDIVGESEAIAQARKLASTVAAGESSVVVYGETGTGKELFAQSMHNGSRRWNKPFVAINCGAMPASIIESYLFGYEAGSFTGARKGGSSGAFEQADGGTVFLDEISEMDFSLQSKILRVLQEREIVRIGGNRPTPVDIRILAATNRDLRQMVEEGVFRKDLYYRLNVVQVVIPPLRDRPADIALLVRTFIQRNNQLFGKFVFSPSPEALALLTSHNWPGNIRELQNCVEYAFNLINADEQFILPRHLPRYLREQAGFDEPCQPGLTERPGAYLEAVVPAGGSVHSGALPFPNLAEALHHAERDCIRKALAAARDNRRKAAALLGISTTTLWRRMTALGVASAETSVPEPAVSASAPQGASSAWDAPEGFFQD